jgi:phage/plasmid-like protein (TIGR03299 family)
MSHDIDMSNGRANFAHAGRKAWHGLGIAVPGLMTAREALVAGGVDYEVEKRPLWAEENGLATLAIPGHFATVRTDTNQPLGVVGSRYEVVQNRDALSFFDPALGEGAAAIDSVGSLAGGKRAFMLAKIPEVVEIVPGDAVERYLLFSNSHDGSSAVEVLFTPVRVVCQNTLSAALSDAKRKKAGRVSIRHTAGAKERLEAAHEVLGQEREYFKRIKAAFVYLAKRDLGRAEVASFVRDLFPGKLVDGKVKVSTKTRNRRKAVVNAFEQSPGSDMAGTTAWGLFNAATYFIDHERSLPESTDAWEASVVGSGVGLRQSAFDLALAL